MPGMSRLLPAGLIGVVIVVGVVVARGLPTVKEDREPAAPEPGGAQASAQAPALARILTDDRLWGDDAFALFSSLPALRAIGESAIVIYPDRATIGTSFATLDSAQQRVAAVTDALKRVSRNLRPEFAPIAERAARRPPEGWQVTAIKSLEDDRFHVVWQREGAQFLRQGVLMRTVIETYGRPEGITTEVVHSEGDRRPAVLTIHRYVNGAVRFIESDLASTPGIDRVILDIGAVTTQVFR